MEQPSKRFCQHCGASNRLQARYCRACATPLLPMPVQLPTNLSGRLIRVWWGWLPRATSRKSRVLGAAFLDGRYLINWSNVAAYAPLAALIIGVVVGLSRSYSEETFTFSLFWMSVMLAVSAFSAALGVWVTVGYGTADFLRHVSTNAFMGSAFDKLAFAGALAISYVLLAMLLIFVPLVSQGLCRNTLQPLDAYLRRRSFGTAALLLLSIVLYPLIQSALVYAWTQNVPTLIRPIYTWRGFQPPVPAISPLQDNGSVLVALAGVLAVIRVILEFRPVEAGPPPYAALLWNPQTDKSTAKKTGKATTLLGVIGKAALTTAFLGGLITSWWQAVVVWAAVFGALLFRNMISTRQSYWARLISTVPLILRIALASFISYAIASQVIRLMWDQSETFLPVVISTLVCLLIFAILVPSSTAQTDGRSSTKKSAA